MRQSIAIISLLASSACAQEVVSFYYPGGGQEGVTPVATIQSVNPSTTEFRVACPTGVDSSDCGYGPGINYTVISKTRYQAVMSAGPVSVSFGCDYNTQAVEMTCTVDQKGGNDNTDGPATAILSSSEIAFISATVVEGASLLSGGGSVSATQAPKSTGAAASTSGSATASGSSAAKSQASGSATQTGSGAAASSTGAAARFGVEGSALLALAGAAALNVW